jgi:uncharacterized protein (TIGR02421 family)
MAATSTDPLDDHRALVRDLSDRLIAAQADIRVLDAVKWDDGVRDAFFARGCREQPPVDAAYYERRPLPFDLEAARRSFLHLDTEIATRLGSATAAAQLLRRTCEQYRLTLDLLASRGTPRFGTYATLLYGTPGEVFYSGGPTVEGLADSIAATLDLFEPSLLVDREPKDLDGMAAVALLQAQLDASMGPGLVDVKLDDGIVSDAAAGSTYIKLRADARFSLRDIATLEAHEGWVHVGTTLNGLAQPVCTFLGKAAPPATVTQEGLATLTELLSLRSHLGRLRRIVNRIRGIRLALDGASFVEVFEYFRTEGLDEDEAWTTTARLFRGSTPTGPPFTKDLAYGKGLVLTYVYVRLALRQGRPERIPMLFCGKIDLQALGLVSHLFDEGVVEPPRFVPPPFTDLEALSAQVAFSRFLRELDFDRLEAEYGQLL